MKASEASSAFGDDEGSSAFKPSAKGFVRRHAVPALGPATSAAKAAVAERKKLKQAQRKKDRCGRVQEGRCGVCGQAVPECVW